MMPNRITQIKYFTSLVFAMSFVCLSAWFGQTNVVFNQASVELNAHLDDTSATLDSNDKLIGLIANKPLNLPCCCGCCQHNEPYQCHTQNNPYLIALQRAPPSQLI